MLHIGICDDDLRTAGELETMIANTMVPMKLQFDTDVYSSGEELLEALDNGASLDLLFLDIEIKAIDGIRAGEIIRFERYDYDTMIIYVSRHDHLHSKLYRNKPSGFMRKPLT